VRRERLFERLDQGVRRPLTLLAAPPGAGKTALLGFFVGQVMNATKGSANPQLVNETLKRLLGGPTG